MALTGPVSTTALSTVFLPMPAGADQDPRGPLGLNSGCRFWGAIVRG